MRHRNEMYIERGEIILGQGVNRNAEPIPASGKVPRTRMINSLVSHSHKYETFYLFSIRDAELPNSKRERSHNRRVNGKRAYEAELCEDEASYSFLGDVSHNLEIK